LRERKITNIEKNAPDAIVADLVGSLTGSPRASQSRSACRSISSIGPVGGSAPMAMEHRGMVDTDVPARSAAVSSASPRGSSLGPPTLAVA
jgi:hypothetical protein